MGDNWWTRLIRLNVVVSLGDRVLPGIMLVVSAFAGINSDLSGPAIIVWSLAAALLTAGLCYVVTRLWLLALQADTDGRLPAIRSRIVDFCSETPHSKSDAQDPVRALLSYVSSALSGSHSTSLRLAAGPILETGGGTVAWKNAFSDLKGLAFGLADSITVNDIQPFAIQAVGGVTNDMFHSVDLSPTSPQWSVRDSQFPMVPLPIPATGSGSQQALQFPGEDIAYGMDYECHPHISKRCRVRVVFRPHADQKSFGILVRMSGRKPNGAAVNNQWLNVACIAMARADGWTPSKDVHSIHPNSDHEWFLALEHTELASGWMQVEADVWKEHENTLATKGFTLVAVSGIRVMGFVDIASIEFIPSES